MVSSIKLFDDRFVLRGMLDVDYKQERDGTLTLGTYTVYLTNRAAVTHGLPNTPEERFELISISFDEALPLGQDSKHIEDCLTQSVEGILYASTLNWVKHITLQENGTKQNK